MRDLIRQLVDDALASGDRMGAEADAGPTATLAADAIRLAAMATTMHFGDAGRATADESHVPEAAG